MIVKVACALLSLPIPSNPSNAPSEEGDKALSTQFEEKTLNKFLLVGSDQSGTSTIFKQVRQIFVTNKFLLVFALLINVNMILGDHE